jgi:hypothetical protein
MKRIICTILFACLACSLAIAEESQTEENETILLAAQAGGFAKWLKEHDVLPGIKKDDKGSMTTPQYKEPPPKVSYPFRIELKVAITGDNSTLHYAIIKTNSTASLELVSAWRILDGKRTDLVVPSATSQNKANEYLQDLMKKIESHHQKETQTKPDKER